MSEQEGLPVTRFAAAFGCLLASAAALAVSAITKSLGTGYSMASAVLSLAAALLAISAVMARKGRLRSSEGQSEVP